MSGAGRVWIALSIAACAGETFDEMGEMAPPCAEGRLTLLEGLNLERSVDYVGDYEDGVLIDSIGTPCAEAPNPDACEDAFDLAVRANSDGGNVRSLITIEGDTARLWSANSLIALLGTLDTAAEAIYFASSLGYSFDCTTRVTRIADGFRLTPAGVRSGGCSGTPPMSDRIEVSRQGIVNDPSTGATIRMGFCAGRGGF